jgi:hypothetical protein
MPRKPPPGPETSSGGPSLRDLQARFWHSLAGEPDAELLATIDASEHLDPAERLDVYRNMYFLRLLEVLREDYPQTAQLVGDEAFADLARAYLGAHPSRHPSVRHVGDALPEFLATAVPAALPAFAADLARLEWARREVFDAPDATPLTASDLAALDPERVAELPLELVPSCMTLVAAWPVHEVWKDPSVAPAPKRTALRVWREGFKVFHAAIDDAEEAALGRLAGGATFATVCELFAQTTSLEEAAREASALLARWLEDGVLRTPPRA